MSVQDRHVPAALLGTLLLTSVVVAVAAPPLPIVYPEAPRGSVVDDFHGTKVTDPYRWLEDLDAPATRAWVARERELTEAYVGGLPVRDALRRRLGTLYNFERFDLPFAAWRRVFSSPNTGPHNHSVLVKINRRNR